jgi:hypothetical protein
MNARQRIAEILTRESIVRIPRYHYDKADQILPLSWEEEGERFGLAVVKLNKGFIKDGEYYKPIVR